MPEMNGYVAIVESEPIIGIPSRRLYGPFTTMDGAWVGLEQANVIHRGVDGQNRLVGGWSSAGVLPLRPIETLKDERP